MNYRERMSPEREKEIRENKPVRGFEYRNRIRECLAEIDRLRAAKDEWEKQYLLEMTLKVKHRT